MKETSKQLMKETSIVEAVNERDIKAVNERNIHRFSSDVFLLARLNLDWLPFPVKVQYGTSSLSSDECNQSSSPSLHPDFLSCNVACFLLFGWRFSSHYLELSRIIASITSSYWHIYSTVVRELTPILIPYKIIPRSYPSPTQWSERPRAKETTLI